MDFLLSSGFYSAGNDIGDEGSFKPVRAVHLGATAPITCLSSRYHSSATGIHPASPILVPD